MATGRLAQGLQSLGQLESLHLTALNNLHVEWKCMFEVNFLVIRKDFYDILAQQR